VKVGRSQELQTPSRPLAGKGRFQPHPGLPSGVSLSGKYL